MSPVATPARRLVTAVLASALAWLTLGLVGPVWAADPPEALAEIAHLQAAFGVQPVILRMQARTYTIAKSKSLTAEKLRGVKLQDDPPQLGLHGGIPSYSALYADGTPTPPYKSPRLRNFRFKYFNNEFNLTGYHLYPMQDYASVHGFNIIAPHPRTPLAISHMPDGTKWLAWRGINWQRDLFSGLGIETSPDRWDKMVDKGLNACRDAVFNFGYFSSLTPSEYDYFMVDSENWPLLPGALRAAPFFPTSGTEADKTAFEYKYYRGFGYHTIASVAAARKAGFRGLSSYGFAPYVWAGSLTDPPANPAVDWPWNYWGKATVPTLDIVSPSVYVHDWDPWVNENAYGRNTSIGKTLANNDIQIRYINSLPLADRRPLRPYYWHRFHDQSGWVWWQRMAMTTEEARAMACLGLFTGIDGEDWWDYNGQNENNQLPRVIEAGADVMVRDSLTATLEGTTDTRTFQRYDALHILTVDAGTHMVRFQFIEKHNFTENYGVVEGRPVYTARDSDMTPHLRSDNDCWPGIFEGLALAKQVEYILSHGQVMTEYNGQSSQAVFDHMLPIFRRVRLGYINVVGTYDPLAILDPAQAVGTVTVNDFDGVSGLNVTLPCDSQVRIFVFLLRPPVTS